MKKIAYTLGILAIGFFAYAQVTGYSVGDTATDFSLKGTDDKMHSLSEFNDAKGYIVIFTCNHCPYSVAYEDRIIKLQEEYGPQGYPVIAINPNDPEVNEEDGFEEMKVRAKEKGFNFLYLFDEGQTIYPQYGATRTPHVFLLDKERKVKYIGAIDDNVSKPEEVKEHYLANAIKALQEGEDPSPSKTKAIGCSIKTKK
ncbi:MAG: thioredoxin family protein [Bacteroidia bacterium]|nr:thioredoxin family protein [Bacteroidia bacterium]NNJ55318.1 thioredoxin family protein [Bacteroidia bacterium]